MTALKVELFVHGRKPLSDLVPVDDVPERLHEFPPVVPVIEIVGMLPDIEDHEDWKTRVQVRVVLFDLHDKRTVRLFTITQCTPSRSLDT